MGTSDYTLGKGVVTFNKKESTGIYKGEVDLGNCPEFTFNIALEKLEHYSSRGGLRAKDAEIISQITPTISFTLDEITPQNMALLTLADQEDVTQVAASITAEAHTAYLGKMIALDNRMIDPTSVVVKEGVTTLTLDVDYSIDLTLKDDKVGRIRILDTATITDATAITVDYDILDATFTRLKAISQTKIEGFMRFVSKNPAGNQEELKIWRLSITPAGETALIGDDWSILTFSGEILKDEAGHASNPYFEILMD
jgi:hypothetical protein